MKKGVMGFRIGVLVVAFMSLTGPPAASAQESSSDNTVEMKQYWMVFLKKGPHRDQDSATAARIQEAHLKNIERLASIGKILVAGPFGDDWDTRGIFIMDCKDADEARYLCETDPAVKAGRLVLEIHPWWTAKGGSFK
jgi:uncharacterized protein YciI